MVKKKYGLWTAIAMIIGIVIGSGIFFKSDEILKATGGNAWMAIGAFILSALSIIFGAITVSRLALLSTETGGAVSYFKQFVSKEVGAGFGWFQTFVYFPTLTAVISYVSGVYICMLFGIPGTLEYQVLAGFIMILLLYALNMTLPKTSGIVQIVCMITKLFPLILIAGYGLFAGENSMSLSPEVVVDYTPAHGLGMGAFIAAMLPIVFSYDGWIVSTSISQEIKNEKKNLTLALLIAPAAVLAIYLMYFVGLVRMVGIEHILTSGDNHLYYASEMIFGASGQKVIVAFVTISVIGTLNGLILGHIRLPFSLAENDILGFKKETFVKTNAKTGTPLYSGLLAMGVTLGWLVVHYLVSKFNLLLGSDISELAIASQYLLFLLLYYKVFSLWRKGKVKGVGYGVICPILASIGAIIIFVSGFTKPFVFLVGIIIVAICAGIGGYINSDKRKGKQKNINQDNDDVIDENSDNNIAEVNDKNTDEIIDEVFANNDEENSENINEEVIDNDSEIK